MRIITWPNRSRFPSWSHVCDRRCAVRDWNHREIVTFRDLSLDLHTRRAVRDGKSITLTTREFDLLATFVREPRRVFTREQLIAQVWGDHSSVTGNAVETYISYLRHKIDYGFAEQLLHTIRGVGYALRSPQYMLRSIRLRLIASFLAAWLIFALTISADRAGSSSSTSRTTSS